MFKRIYLAYFSLCVVFGMLIVNLGFIIADIDSSPATTTQGTKSYLISSSRGMIYDRNMEKLVNCENENFAICLPSTEILSKIEKYVADGERQNIYNNLKNGKITIFPTNKTFSENHIKSVSVCNRYSNNQPCVHLIGHLDENGVGAMGLEKAYQNFFNLSKGEIRAVWSVDALGNPLFGEGISIKNDGYNSPMGIQLTIDLTIQKIAENALINHNVTKGAVVILDGSTNEILAMASVPTFDPNNLGKSVNDENLPFINRAITPYSVGSIFKPFVSSVAIENDIEFEYECVGSIKIGSTQFKCSNNTAHGLVDMNSAMEMSCNTYFIALGQKVGTEKLISICSDFGLGKPIELADNFNLKSGKLPTVESINSPQALANLSFGQGELLASPLQMAVAYSCFTNGGFYQHPTLMKAIIDENGKAIQKVELPEKYRIINENTANRVDGILKNVVTNGNGNKAYSFITNNHGKTATAQSGWYENGKEINHTWFCGYFYFNGKTYVVSIFKEDGISGANDCAPVFKEISDNIVKLG